MKKNLLFTLFLMVSVTMFGQKLPFQGKLIESGTPVDGARTLEFSIAGQAWSETHTDVPITDGLYFVVLGSINPLPDSLFYGVDEQSLDISVDGTALSPVILFKPLATPYEGTELNVKNSEGTIVGTLKARTDTVKHGEFMLHGEDTGEIKASFFKANGDTYTDMPFLSLQRDNAVLSSLSSSKWNDDLSGRIYLGSTSGDFANIYPNYFYGNHNGRSLFSIGHSNWSGSENFGLLLLDGPNSGNFELTGQHWDQNPDLPFFKMKGSENQTTLILSTENNPDESGTISLNTKRDDNLIYRELNINSTGLNIRKKENWNVLHEAVSLKAENRDDLGWAGYFNLRGPNSENVQFGTRHWQGTPDFPLINLFGENNFHGIELSITRDGENNQFGWINLMSENGKSLHLSPNNLGVQGVGMSTTTNNSGTFGSLTLHGPNSDNFQFMPSWWDQPDLPRMLLLGTSQKAAVDMGADLDGQGNENGYISISNTDGSSADWNSKKFTMRGTSGEDRILSIIENDDRGIEVGRYYTYSADEKLTRIEPTNITLFDASGGNWNGLASIGMNNNNGNGWAGQINLNGPSSGNISLGSKNWENADLPWLALDGTSTNLIHLTAIGGATEFGYMHLISEDGSTSNISAYRIENNNGAGMVGYFGPDRATFNDNGQEMTYNAWGISGAGSLNIGMDVTVNGTVTETSDKRFKKNIQPVKNSLDKIQLIEGVSYNWRQDEFPEKNFSSDKQIGVIAQELEVQFPELVKTNNNGYKSVNYNGFTAVLLEAVKELNAKVEKLETENMQLKAELSSTQNNTSEIAQLKDQMEALVKMVQSGQSNDFVNEESVSTPGLK